MQDIFHDISKYYAGSIYNNMLTIGKIVFHAEVFGFARDYKHGLLDLSDAEKEVTQAIRVIGEIHPLSALENIIDVRVTSCLYLNENTDSGEIEVRTIHKGMGTSIYSKQECPIILWNPNYEEHRYFDVIDIQSAFTDLRIKNSFSAILSESLRELELFPPLMHLKK